MPKSTNTETLALDAQKVRALIEETKGFPTPRLKNTNACRDLDRAWNLYLESMTAIAVALEGGQYV